MVAADFELAPPPLHASRNAPVTVRAPRRFDLVGLRWSAGGPSPRVRVRVRRDGGHWTHWFQLAPGDSGPHASDPLWTGGSDTVQYRLSRPVRGLRLHFVRISGTEPRSAELQGASASEPTIRPRSDWDASQCPPRVKPELGEVDAVFIHQTETTNSYSRGDVPRMILGICRYHRDSNGWNDIGYDFLVDRFGRIWEGRAGGVDKAVAGAHTQGFNDQSTGIANVGSFDSSGQTSVALHAVARLIHWKLSLHRTPTQGRTRLVSAGGPTNRWRYGSVVLFNRIAGHRDADATSCPGNALYAQLPHLRELVGPGEAGPPRPHVKLKLDTSPAELHEGHLVTASGSIHPYKRYAMLHLDRRTADGSWRPFRRVALPVSHDRTFEQSLRLRRHGHYRVYMRFAGDARRAPTRSAIRLVRVTRSSAR